MSGRKVLVTGAGAGIGEAVARGFAAEGDIVVVADVNEVAAHRVATEIGGTPWPGYVRTALVDEQVADQARLHGIPEEAVLERVFLAESAVKRLVEPSEVADLALWLASPSAAMANGASYTLDGGWGAK